MTEWSKWPATLNLGEPYEPVRVVHAELAQELYEALVYEITRQGGPLLVEEVRASEGSVLARYEREVKMNTGRGSS